MTERTTVGIPKIICEQKEKKSTHPTDIIKKVSSKYANERTKKLMQVSERNNSSI